MKLCPDCGSGLKSSQVENVAIDGCPQCGGTWLDQGELGKLRTQGPDAIDQAEESFEPGLETLEDRAGTHACPACGQGLNRYRYALTDLELETCATHCGIWLDDGELGRISNRLTAPLPPAAQQAAASLQVETQRNIARAEAITRISRTLNRRIPWFRRL